MPEEATTEAVLITEVEAQAVSVEEEPRKPLLARSKYNLAVGTVIFVLVVIIVVLTTHRGDSDDSTALSLPLSPYPTPGPTFESPTPSAPPTEAPLPTMPTQEVNLQLSEEYEKLGLDPSSLDAPNSAAGKAMEWLSSHLTGAYKTDLGMQDFQAYGLAVFYFATVGSGGWPQPQNWLDSYNFCQWHGVTCHQGKYLVSKIEISAYGIRNSLIGTLPEEMAFFDGLNVLRLDFTDITDISALRHNWIPLVTVASESGKFKPDTLDIFVGMPNLETIYLPYNKASGYISNDSLWDSLPRLTSLSLQGAGLTGTLPGTRTLEYIDMTGNNLEGTLEPLMNMPNLYIVRVDNNNLRGTIPTTIGLLNQLDQFKVSSNILTGTIPTELGKLDKLRFLQLDDNNFEKQIPSELGQCPSLQHLSASENSLTGTIPEELFRRHPHHFHLYIHHNQIRGTMPEALCSGAYYDILIDHDLVECDVACCRIWDV